MLRRCLVATGLVLAALCAGCSGGNPRSDNMPQSTFEADYHDCESRGYVSTAFIPSADEAAEKRQAIVDDCMKEKGYNVR